ncbi:flagellar biosynthesis protein FlhF [Leptospira wolffii]|uniref:flagellar biosynthesis protein FlhF n=1 Tax=Leptospira wolffii TaxID=409998 RepID=UPI00108317F2|nr:flagellar biosynthesis protein FlhF [Leptospira wolffii]TGK60118.1 flagellar biosynthesis protein FlhF [Leptospira wolffii]TGK72461.1 flagellar biosynthesis protein FlhF [Leptospira wolffii]TGK76125.1 flagellar biosynthesis protein FlhF [Leptospira wolffii]TGL30377.1 flagellar biosynthesis protein FlhF [Leptospira wolffii]
MDFAKIRGKDLQDCLMQMKMKYGPEAHVIEHRILTEGGVFGTGLMAKKVVEIQVGIPEKASSREKVEKKLQDLKELLKQKSIQGTERRRSLDELPSWEERSVRPRAASSLPKELTEPEEFETVPEKVGISFSREFEPKTNIRKPEQDSLILRLRDRLVKEGMTESYAEEIVSAVELRLSPLDRSRAASIQEKTVEVLSERVQAEPDLFQGTRRGQRKVVFFVGPTGSGKTTSIAKLAAKYHLHMGKGVSLYTTDNYRIAAIEQLKRYADTMEMPFYAVKDLKRFQETLARDGSELILIDTAGYSHRNVEQLGKMHGYLSAFGEKDNVENILVLSATSSYHHSHSVMKAYEPLGFRRILLTKLDEAEFLGGFLELADTLNKGFTHLSVGQEVPFDMIPAEKHLLAECAVNPEKIIEIRGEVFSA